MIRTIINDDENGASILRGLQQNFYHQTVTYNDIIGYISKQSGIEFITVFDQYLRYPDLPTLQLTWQDGKPYCKWIADAKGFNMPVKVRLKAVNINSSQPTTTVQPIDLPGATKETWKRIP